MSYTDSTSEEYARQRLVDSPLSRVSLRYSQPTVIYQESTSVKSPSPQVKPLTRQLKPANYRFLQNALVNIVVMVQHRENDHDLTKLVTICDIIDQEVSCIRFVGQHYINEIRAALQEEFEEDPGLEKDFEDTLGAVPEEESDQEETEAEEIKVELEEPDEQTESEKEEADTAKETQKKLE